MARGPFEWDEDVQRLGERVDDLFDRVFGLASAPRYGLQHAWRPNLDVYRVADGLAVIAELPGVDEGDLQVVAEHGRLRISGTRHPARMPPPSEPLRLELDYGPFERIVTLPPEADPDHITARFRLGLLEVHVPLRGSGGAVQIPINEPSDDGDE